MDFYSALGKRPILIKKETPGFVANRLQTAVTNEACSLVANGVVSASDLDAAMSTGLGLRWSLTGPFMTNVLGGGGGPEGFDKIMDHLGPATRSWTKDMEAKKFEWSDRTVKAVKSSVREMIEGEDFVEMMRERDEVLLEYLKSKTSHKLLV